jgi:hypothetical protein
MRMKWGKFSSKGCDWHVPIGNVDISALWMVEGAMARIIGLYNTLQNDYRLIQNLLSYASETIIG